MITKYNLSYMEPYLLIQITTELTNTFKTKVQWHIVNTIVNYSGYKDCHIKDTKYKSK